MGQATLLLEGQFVDRERELGILGTLFDQALAGKGCTAFILGEAGVGKTRLVRQFRKLAESKGAVFLEGSSYEQEGIVPYSPWVDVIQSLFDRTTADRLRKLPGWIVPEIGRLIPSIHSKAESLGLRAWVQGPGSSSMIMAAGTDQDRVRLFQAITDCLVSFSKDQPVVIFLDDIAWADQASLQLFNYVARRIPERKIMLIGAYRDVELSEDHPLTNITLDLNRRRLAQQVSVARLNQGLVRQLLTTHLRGPVSEELSQLIYSRTGGNPYFVEEIIRSVVDDGLIQKSAGGWTVGDSRQVDIPITVRALIKRRTSRLKEDCIQFLSIAALMGGEFDVEILKLVSTLSEESITESIEAALKAHLIREKKEAGKLLFVFADEQVREFMADQAGLVRRRKYHIGLGQALEEAYKDKLESHPAELAYHFVQGAEPKKAKKYSILAGEMAARLYAHADSVKHFTNALELLGKDELETKLDLLTKLGRVSYIRGNHRDVERYCREAIEIAQKLGLKTALADLHGLMGISRFSLADSKEEALSSFLTGLKILEGTEDTLEEAVLCQHLGRVYSLTGDPDLGRKWAERAIDIASKLKAYEVLAHSYLTLALTFSLKEKNSIFEYVEKALSLSIEHGLAGPALRAYNNLASYFATAKCDFRRAKELFLNGIAYARKLGYLDLENFMQLGLVSDVYFPMGDWEECQRLAFTVIAIGRELESKNVVGAFAALASIALARGDLAKAKEYSAEALPIAKRGEWTAFILQSIKPTVDVSIAENRLEDAERDLLQVFDRRKKMTGVDTEFLEIAFRLVLLNLKRQRMDQALLHHRQLQEMASELEENWGFALERWARGLIAEAEHEGDEAIKLLQASVDLWKTVQQPYYLAQTLLDLARVEKKAGLKEAAKQSIETAGKIFVQLGIPKKPGP